jgi:adenosylhomocysteinase
MSQDYDVKDLSLADQGKDAIEWADMMDMSFANQALCAEHMLLNAKNLEKKVYLVPKDIDREIARLKLHSMGVKVDVLTSKQAKYPESWEEGT